MSPAFEDAFEKHEIIAETESLETLEVLTLFLKCNAVKLGKFILGSKKSRYSASLMKVKNTNVIVTLAEVQHYARCTAFNERTRTKKEVWLVAVNFFESHVCKVWYGKPMEVWPAIPVPNLYYIPISFIVSRIAYRDCWVNFGRN